jgi:hypothetical protein
MHIFQIVVLALIQGITEFLPISSSGHLLLVPALTGWPDQGLLTDVMVHMGSFLAVVVYFWKDCVNLTLGFADLLRGKVTGWGKLALMIVLGYPGEIAADLPTRAFWGSLSMIPFLYIVLQLFVGLGKSMKEQPAAARGLIRFARLLTVASWGFYPIVFFAPFMGLTGGSVETTIQVGYTIADLVAKAGIGILIFLIAVRKSESDTDGVKGHAA